MKMNDVCRARSNRSDLICQLKTVGFLVSFFIFGQLAQAQLSIINKDADSNRILYNANEFARHVENKIRAVGLPEIGYPPVKGSFRISQSGIILNLRVNQSCGKAELDYAVLQTVQRSSPFDRIPADLGEFQDVNFTVGACSPSDSSGRTIKTSAIQMEFTGPYISSPPPMHRSDRSLSERGHLKIEPSVPPAF